MGTHFTFHRFPTSEALTHHLDEIENHAVGTGHNGPLEFGDFVNEDALHTVSTGFSTANEPVVSGTSSSNTVSPQDVFAMSPSAPNSNSFTNLTTPSMYDGSPDDSFETSPLFGNDNVSGPWTSLFPEESDTYAPAVRSNQDLSSSRESLTKPTSAEMNRTASSSSVDVKSEDALRHRLSISSGVTKNKRTGRSLGPIEVDESDSKALKRAKNTMAARKSRQKKRDVEEGLRCDLAAMTAERDKWMHVAIAHGAPIPESTAPARKC